MSSSPDRAADPILRGSQAQSVTTARFEVDLRRTTEAPIPAEVIERVTAEARATGYAEGWAQGQREARVAAGHAAAQVAAEQREFERIRAHALEQALDAVAAAAEQLERRTVPAATELAEQVLHGMVELAEALLGRELADAPDRGLDALRRVMAPAPQTGTVTVRLHPADFASLGADGSDYVFHGRPVVLRPDASLSPGDALAEQGTTTVDARLSEAIRRVREVLDQ